MNSIILELSALENKIIDNTKIYGLEIHKKISEMLEVEDKNDLRVSNIFGEFFKKRIELEKNEKYKITTSIYMEKGFDLEFVIENEGKIATVKKEISVAYNE